MQPGADCFPQTAHTTRHYCNSLSHTIHPIDIKLRK
jgi:hypothetical protein